MFFSIGLVVVFLFAGSFVGVVTIVVLRTAIMVDAAVLFGSFRDSSSFNNVVDRFSFDAVATCLSIGLVVVFLIVETLVVAAIVVL